MTAMNTNEVKILKASAEKTVSGLHTKFCDDALAHAVKNPITSLTKQDYPHAKFDDFSEVYDVRIQAYLPGKLAPLPELFGGNCTVKIDVIDTVDRVNAEVIKTVDHVIEACLEEQNNVAEEVVQNVNFALTQRTIQIVYNSPSNDEPPFDLWCFHVQYAIKETESVPFIKINLKNIDPETTRGTVTTVEDPSGND